MPRRRPEQSPGDVWGYLVDKEPEGLRRSAWRHRLPYFAERLGKLEAGEPVQVQGFYLGEHRPPHVGQFDMVMVEPDGTLTVTYRTGQR